MFVLTNVAKIEPQRHEDTEKPLFAGLFFVPLCLCGSPNWLRAQRASFFERSVEKRPLTIREHDVLLRTFFASRI
jgi:hypothetical protein